jgi:hypothetical protein
MAALASGGGETLNQEEDDRMGMGDWWRGRKNGRPARLIGHVTEAPRQVTENGATYMLFRLREADGTEFRLKMLPTTPKRHEGDCVEVTYVRMGEGRAVVEAMTAVRDPAATRRRNEEYLKQIASQDRDH